MTLRLVDTETGEALETDASTTIEELREQNSLKDTTIEDLERELRSKRRTISELRGERTKDLSLDPRASKVRELFELWQKLLGHPKSKLDDKRMERGLWALRHYEFEMCERAVWGMGERPYVGDRGRSKTGKSSERHDDFALIFRSAQHVERFAAYGDAKPEVPAKDETALPDYLAARCDCGHMRVEHSKADPARMGQQACLGVHRWKNERGVEEADPCPCEDFDDIGIRVEAWVAKQRKLAAAGHKLSDAAEASLRLEDVA